MVSPLVKTWNGRPFQTQITQFVLERLGLYLFRGKSLQFRCQVELLNLLVMNLFILIPTICLFVLLPAYLHAFLILIFPPFKTRSLVLMNSLIRTSRVNFFYNWFYYVLSAALINLCPLGRFLHTGFWAPHHCMPLYPIHFKPYNVFQGKNKWRTQKAFASLSNTGRNVEGRARGGGGRWEKEASPPL